MKKVLIALLIVIIVAVLGLGGFIIWQLSKKIDKQNEDISTLINEIRGGSETTTNNTVANNVVTNNITNQTVDNNVVNNQTQPANNNQTVVASMEEQVKKAYAEYLSQNSNIIEYKIDSVTILTDEQKKSLLSYDNGQFYKETDTLATIGYAVKTKDGIVVGNGEKSGEWIINKSACVCYRDGKIVSDGTGW